MKSGRLFITFVLFYGILALGVGARPCWADPWDPRLQRSMELSFAGQLEEAENQINSYRRDHPEDPNGIFLWTFVQEWKAGLGPGNHRDIYPKLREPLEQALELAEKNLKKTPEKAQAWIDLGNSYFFLARNLAEQGSKFRAGMTGKKIDKPMKKALELDPSRYEAFLAMGAFHYFAGNTPKIFIPIKLLLGIRGNKDEGLKELHRALQGKHPFLWQARFALLEIYSHGEKDPKKAMAQLVHFERAFPKNPAVPLKKGFILEEEDPQRAVAVYLDLVEGCGIRYQPCPKKFPFAAYSQAGWVLFKEGETERALKFLAKALEYDPKNYPDRTDEIKKLQKEAAKDLAKQKKQKKS